MISLIRGEDIARLHLNGKGGGMLTEQSGSEIIGGGLRVRIFGRKKIFSKQYPYNKKYVSLHVIFDACGRGKCHISFSQRGVIQLIDR
jgi:hypothetical protein